MSQEGRENNEKRFKALERRQKALEMRKTGHDYKTIGKALGVTAKTAFMDVQKCLEEIRANTHETAEDVLELELKRLDIAQAALMPRVKDGDPRAIDTLMRVQERRAKYLGLDAANKVEISGKGIIINLTPADFLPPAQEQHEHGH
jgi:hypothetical protein